MRASRSVGRRRLRRRAPRPPPASERAVARPRDTNVRRVRIAARLLRPPRVCVGGPAGEARANRATDAREPRERRKKERDERRRGARRSRLRARESSASSTTAGLAFCWHLVAREAYDEEPDGADDAERPQHRRSVAEHDAASEEAARVVRRDQQQQQPEAEEAHERVEGRAVAGLARAVHVDDDEERRDHEDREREEDDCAPVVGPLGERLVRLAVAPRDRAAADALTIAATLLLLLLACAAIRAGRHDVPSLGEWGHARSRTALQPSSGGPRLEEAMRYLDLIRKNLRHRTRKGITAVGVRLVRIVVGSRLPLASTKGK